jgi:hypothetical protein
MRVWLTLLVCLVVAGGAVAYSVFSNAKPGLPEGAPFPTTFVDCERYFPVADSYPRHCTLPNGSVLTEDIGNTEQVIDDIRLTAPRANASVESPLVVRGEAHKDWFSDEFTLSIELYAADGSLLGKTSGEIKRAVLGKEFYAFEGVLGFPLPRFGTTGRLKIYKEGSSEHLEIPVAFK